MGPCQPDPIVIGGLSGGAVHRLPDSFGGEGVVVELVEFLEGRDRIVRQVDALHVPAPGLGEPALLAE